MTEEELTPLLHRSESESLDFKRDAYSFSGATDDVKSELLKDIVAFANAWKDSDACNLVGIEEENGRVKSIPGAALTLRDHDVQQFINSKTNRRIDFNIEIHSHRSVNLTIIKILKVQARPIFLVEDFGRLKKKSSTSGAAAAPARLLLMKLLIWAVRKSEERKQLSLRSLCNSLSRLKRGETKIL